MAASRKNRTGLVVIWIAGISLFVLHQDFWFWHDDRLVFGFMPMGLAYHALYSILAAVLWALTLRIAWPYHLEEFAESLNGPANRTDQERPA